MREIRDPDAVVTVHDGERVDVYEAKAVTVKRGGKCWTCGNSRPTVTVKRGGECRTYGDSSPEVTVENGGRCWIHDNSNPRVVLKCEGEHFAEVIDDRPITREKLT
jgi:hypothetical protein